jgi:hypothetical protein
VRVTCHTSWANKLQFEKISVAAVLEIEHLRTTDPDEYEYDAGKPVDTFWDLGYFDNVAICSPAPTFTALTAYPGTVVRRLYRQGVVSAIS